MSITFDITKVRNIFDIRKQIQDYFCCKSIFLESLWGYAISIRIHITKITSRQNKRIGKAHKLFPSNRFLAFINPIIPRIKDDKINKILRFIRNGLIVIHFLLA